MDGIWVGRAGQWKRVYRRYCQSADRATKYRSAKPFDAASPVNCRNQKFPVAWSCADAVRPTIDRQNLYPGRLAVRKNIRQDDPNQRNHPAMKLSSAPATPRQYQYPPLPPMIANIEQELAAGGTGARRYGLAFGRTHADFARLNHRQPVRHQTRAYHGRTFWIELGLESNGICQRTKRNAGDIAGPSTIFVVGAVRPRRQQERQNEINVPDWKQTKSSKQPGRAASFDGKALAGCAGG